MTVSLSKLMLSLLSVALLSACDTESGGGGGGDPTQLTPPNISVDPITVGTVDLSNVSLAANSAAPLDLLPVTGLPADLPVSALHAEFRTADDDWPVGPGVEGSNIAAMLAADADDASYLVVPLIAAAGGDELKLRITDGASYSRTLKLSVSALAEAEPDLVDDWVDAIEAMLITVTEAYELEYPADLQNYLSNPASIDYEFVPLIRTYQALIDSANPNNLRRITAEMNTDERQALARLLAQVDAVGELQGLTRYAASDDTLIAEALPVLNAVVTQISGEYVPDSSLVTETETVSPRTVSPRIGSSFNPVVINGAFPIDGPDDLAFRIKAYNVARFAQTLEQTRQEYAGYFVMGVGVGAAFLASGPGGSAVAAEVLVSTKAAGSILAAAGMVDAMATVTRGFWPCCIVSVDMILDPMMGTVLNEDEVDPSLVLEWTVARVHSDGINLVDDLLVPLTSSIAEDKLSGVLNKLSATSVFDEEINSIIASLALSDVGADVPEIIFEWVPVDISGEEPEKWVEIGMEGFAATIPMFEQVPSANPETITYRLDEDVFFYREDSTDVLTVSPNPESFELKTWHPPIPAKSLPIGANTISVDFEPRGIRLEEPGEVVPFVITVSNALDTELELPLVLEPNIGEVDGPLSESDGVYQFTYTAPAEMPNEMIRISTRATSTGGVRGRIENPTARIGSMLIETDSVSLDVFPGRSCMEQDDRQTFSAIDPLLGTPVEVIWTAELGTIDSQGQYTAPAAQMPGNDTIRATSIEDGTVEATARVTFGCSCWWQGSVDGGFSQAGGDFSMSYGMNDAWSAIESVLITSSNGNFPGAVFKLDQPIASGTTGTSTARVAGGNFTNSVNSSNFWANRTTFVGPILRGDGPVAPLLVSVTRHTMLDPVNPNNPKPNRDLALTITGTVYYETADENGNAYFDKRGPLNISFQGNRWVGTNFNYFRCTPPRPG